MKTHLTGGCGRGKRTTDDPYRVDCLVCKDGKRYDAVKRVADFEREKAFRDQIPQTVVPMFGRVNDDGVMECYNCHGVLFRERPRSLFSFHFVCANCGTSMHPLTETGMST